MYFQYKCILSTCISSTSSTFFLVFKKTFNVQLTSWNTCGKKIAFFYKIPYKSAKLYEKSAKLCISCKTMKNSVILFASFTFNSVVIQTLVILCWYKNVYSKPAL